MSVHLEIDENREDNRAADKSTAWWQPAVFIFLKMSAWVALPVIMSLYLGDWLETKYGRSLHLQLIIVLAAFVITILGMFRIARQELKKMDPDKSKENKLK